MAFRKTPDDNPDEITQAQQKIHDAAQGVTKAAEKFNGIPLNRFITKDELKRLKQDVEGTDDLFAREEQDMLKDIEVRVMKYDPTGRMTDVTDRIRPGDIRADQIADIRADRGLPIPRNADGKLDQEGALDLLTALLSGGRRGVRLSPEAVVQRQMREMEVVLDEAGKTLEHWKK